MRAFVILAAVAVLASAVLPGQVRADHATGGAGGSDRGGVAPPAGPCDLLKACHDPTSCPVLKEAPPPTFGVEFHTTVGSFTVNVVTAWAPPYATRMWQLARLQYWDGASFYRTLYKSATNNFVVQFGYRGVPDIDACWDAHMTSNATWSVHAPGNVRGTVSFSMDAVGQTHSNPNCTSPSYCAQGFSTNIFVNYGNNSRLDAPGFSPVGTVDEAGMKVVDALYAGYGEVRDLCAAGSSDPFCVGTGISCKGVDMTTLVKQGDEYLKSFPLLTKVTTTELHSKPSART